MASTPVSAPSANLITALGAGSGVDTKALATNLVEAERAPAKAIIDKRIASANANVAGYSALKFIVGNLQSAFADLKDQSDFNSLSSNISQPTALSINVSPSAASGLHSVSVSQLATAQRNLTAGFASASTALNGGVAFSLSLSVNAGASASIAVSDTTPAGVVSAINAAALGVSARLISTGESLSPYKILLSGGLGAAQSFALSSLDANGVAVAGLDFSVAVSSAQNALLTVDGVAITASNNQVQDAIQGTTINLFSTTNGNATLSLNRDSSPTKAKLQALVSAYNDVQTVLNTVADPKSTVESYGASLVGNSLVTQLRAQVRSTVLANSSSPSGGLSALRHLGLSLDKNGQLTLDEVRLSSVLANQFDSVVTLLTANRENLSTFSLMSAGVAGDAVKKLSALIDRNSALAHQSTNVSGKIATHQKDLAKLETRMSALLERYTQQFAGMDAIVGRSSSLRTSLKSSFEGMMAMYTNK